MTDYFLLLVIVVLVIPANFENNDILTIPILNANRKKSVQVFPVPRNLKLSKRSSLIRLNDFDKPNEPLNVKLNINIRISQDREEIPQSKLSRIRSDTMQNDNIDNGDDTDGLEKDNYLYLYQVAYGTLCGGAIIGSKWVLTAAHCGKEAFIRFGSIYQDDGKKVLVQENHFHPMWEAKNKEHAYDYDFQVLELARELRLDEDLKAIKVGRLDDMAVGKVMTVTGWMTKEENGKYSSVLRGANVPIISKALCQKVQMPYFKGRLTPRMFCAEQKKYACLRDSGGPAVASDRLIGVASFGYGCASPGSYGVYAKVSTVRDWIQNVTLLNLD